MKKNPFLALLLQALVILGACEKRSNLYKIILAK